MVLNEELGRPELVWVHDAKQHFLHAVQGQVLSEKRKARLGRWMVFPHYTGFNKKRKSDYLAATVVKRHLH